ncbi:hypothetical protein WN51_10306 [Melipona quadrifasciata]|uniref:Uncharacterized protein n=1 Tax=Melipona quadrifasciata TaxID=166423 RepID=A0A0M9A628_9HYME|nr:hypothetical protein WN51_10306 [Melipona quadrifasciata]
MQKLQCSFIINNFHCSMFILSSSNLRNAITQYQTTPLLLEVYPTPLHESRDSNQPIANFRCISVAPEEVRFSGLPPLKSFSVTQSHCLRFEVRRVRLNVECYIVSTILVPTALFHYGGFVGSDAKL